MIFEIPMQHFPPSRMAYSNEERPRAHNPLIRRAKCQVLTNSCLELSRAVAEKSEVPEPRPRINSVLANAICVATLTGAAITGVKAPAPAHVKPTITRSQSVPAVPRDRQLSRSERIQKSIGAFSRRVATLITISPVIA